MSTTVSELSEYPVQIFGMEEKEFQSIYCYGLESTSSEANDAARQGHCIPFDVFIRPFCDVSLTDLPSSLLVLQCTQTAIALISPSVVVLSDESVGDLPEMEIMMPSNHPPTQYIALYLSLLKLIFAWTNRSRAQQETLKTASNKVRNGQPTDAI